MKIIVDTNILFSAMLNTESAISKLLLFDSRFGFYAPNFINTELTNHQPKLMKMLSLKSTKEWEELKSMITQYIIFIDESNISKAHWKKADLLTKDVDSDDIAFVALAEQLDGLLWTGDKKLMKGLREKGYDSVIDTQNILEIHRSK